jgi:hypothetical protein
MCWIFNVLQRVVGVIIGFGCVTLIALVQAMFRCLIFKVH